MPHPLAPPWPERCASPSCPLARTLCLTPLPLPLPLPPPQVRTVSCILRANALRSGKGLNVTFGSKANNERVASS